MPSSDGPRWDDGGGGGGGRAGADLERRVLIVAAEAALTHGLRLTLEADGYQTLAAVDGLDGLRWLREGLPDLVVVDGDLPEADAAEFVRAVREVSLAPVLVLVRRLESATIIHLLDQGADDCAAKPLAAPELLARLRALLRRARLPPLLERTMVVVDDDLRIDFSRALVLARGQPVGLRPTEYRLLYHLVSHPGRILTYESLLARVWGQEYRQETHYVRLYVTYLRQKIEPEPHQPRYILNARGLGYRFVDFRRRRATITAGESDEHP
jgi:two-component system KDP operon response regulator KdpE